MDFQLISTPSLDFQVPLNLGEAMSKNIKGGLYIGSNFAASGVGG